MRKIKKNLQTRGGGGPQYGGVTWNSLAQLSMRFADFSRPRMRLLTCLYGVLQSMALDLMLGWTWHADF